MLMSPANHLPPPVSNSPQNSAAPAGMYAGTRTLAIIPEQWYEYLASQSSVLLK